MGFHAKQFLTKKGYQDRHKPKLNHNILNPSSKLYQHYLRMYHKLIEKNSTEQEILSIAMIMSRSSATARVSTDSNRDLALLDIDKQLSLSLGSFKHTDIRFSVMRRVIEDTQNTRLQTSRNFFDNTRPNFNDPLGNQLFELEIQRREAMDRARFEDMRRTMENRELDTLNTIERRRADNFRFERPLPNIFQNTRDNNQRHALFNDLERAGGPRPLRRNLNRDENPPMNFFEWARQERERERNLGDNIFTRENLNTNLFGNPTVPPQTNIFNMMPRLERPPVRTVMPQTILRQENNIESFFPILAGDEIPERNRRNTVNIIERNVENTIERMNTLLENLRRERNDQINGSEGGNEARRNQREGQEGQVRGNAVNGQAVVNTRRTGEENNEENDDEQSEDEVIVPVGLRGSNRQVIDLRDLSDSEEQSNGQRVIVLQD